MNDPDLVILDEPMSGLDPMGRKTVRDLIFELKDQGKTVFFSSHILQDVEMVCDRVGILKAGQLIREGSLRELLDGDTSAVEIECTHLSQQFVDYAEGVGGVIRRHGEHAMIRLEGRDVVQGLLKACVESEVVVHRMTPVKRTLEEIFVEESTQEVNR
jgi:ABC-2 type transport system ATP-binding protein